MSKQESKAQETHKHSLVPGMVKDWIYDEDGKLQFVIIEYECLPEDLSDCPTQDFERRLIKVDSP